MTDRPVQFQVNQSGSWRTAVRWNASDEQQNDAVLDAADALLRAIGGTSRGISGRVVTDDGLQTVLMRWGEQQGWKAAP
jgi:hypothetical protein